MKKRTMGNIGLIMMGVIISLLLAEAVLRVFGLGYGSAPLESDPVLHHVNPKNYAYRVYDPRGEFGGYLSHYDERGFRFDPEAKPADWASSKFRVALMGDSFVQSSQTEYGESFVGLLQQRSANDVAVLGFGVSSYSPALYQLQWRGIVATLKPTHVLLMLYSNDVDDDAKYTALGKFDREGMLVAVPGGENDGWMRLIRKSYVARLLRRAQITVQYMLNHHGEEGRSVGGFIEQSPDITPLSALYLLHINAMIAGQGAEFVLTAVPSKYLTQAKGDEPPFVGFSEKVKRWAEQNGIRFVDLEPDFLLAASQGKSLFFEHDIHLTKEGNKVVANVFSREFPDLFKMQAIAGNRP